MLEEMWGTAGWPFPCILELPSHSVILAGANTSNRFYFRWWNWLLIFYNLPGQLSSPFNDKRQVPFKDNISNQQESCNTKVATIWTPNKGWVAGHYDQGPEDGEADFCFKLTDGQKFAVLGKIDCVYDFMTCLLTSAMHHLTYILSYILLYLIY